MNISPGVSAVLFDLDGTLLDTAPDMVAALNQVRAEESQSILPYSQARAFVSNGALGLLRFAFGDMDDGTRDRLHRRFLDIYASRLAVATTLFAGMADVLAELECVGVPWGVVTNKPTRLTEPLLTQLGLRARCACVVSGDTTARRKPHPQPLLHALEVIAAPAMQAIYVGDAERDIAAGRAAGMRTVAALYGYIPPDETPLDWGADQLISAPAELLTMLEQIRTRESE